jgi:hypothetical protein
MIIISRNPRPALLMRADVDYQDLRKNFDPTADQKATKLREKSQEVEFFNEFRSPGSSNPDAGRSCLRKGCYLEHKRKLPAWSFQHIPTSYSIDVSSISVSAGTRFQFVWLTEARPFFQRKNSSAPPHWCINANGRGKIKKEEYGEPQWFNTHLFLSDNLTNPCLSFPGFTPSSFSTDDRDLWKVILTDISQRMRQQNEYPKESRRSGQEIGLTRDSNGEKLD